MHPDQTKVGTELTKQPEVGSTTSTSEPIELIKRRHPNKSLAIVVTKTNEFDAPMEGILLYETSNRLELFRLIKGHRERLYITHTYERAYETEIGVHG